LDPYIYIYIYTIQSLNNDDKEWRLGGYPCPKKFKKKKSSSKALASAFWDGILPVNYLERGATILAKYYVALLDKMKQQLVPRH
jgi:hypothetical protein